MTYNHKGQNRELQKEIRTDRTDNCYEGPVPATYPCPQSSSWLVQVPVMSWPLQDATYRALNCWHSTGYKEKQGRYHTNIARQVKSLRLGLLCPTQGQRLHKGSKEVSHKTKCCIKQEIKQVSLTTIIMIVLSHRTKGHTKVSDDCHNQPIDKMEWRVKMLWKRKGGVVRTRFILAWEWNRWVWHRWHPRYCLY